jgi:low molecular weight phosphotyrosine protein phosphatase
MAEAVLKHQIKLRDSLKGKLIIQVDSAGTGAYHEGDDADDRLDILSVGLYYPQLTP